MSLKKIYLFIFSFLLVSQAMAQLLTNVDRQFIQKQLQLKKFNPRFIKDLLQVYDTKSFSSAVRLNMLGFLNPPEHSVLITEEAFQKSNEFIQQNLKALELVEKRDRVPRSVISALLWVETKHGQLTGQYHTPSVYLHLIQTTRPQVLNELIQLAQSTEKLKPKPLKNIKKKLLARSIKKSKWAFEQLFALEKMYKKNRSFVLTLKGSFAGAFGLPQFIPTSYLTYAKPFKKMTVADLYKPEDAISSVANYLKKTGWNTKLKKKKLKALMHYNNSEDYALSILELSQKIDSKKK